MKAFFCILCAALLLIAPAALAEVELELSAQTVAAESIVDFTFSAADAPAVRYTLYRNDEKLFAAETPTTFGSYLPRKTGDYTLKAEALYENGVETAEADFTVVEKLSLQLETDREAVRMGEPVKVHAQANGGSGNYEYTYTVRSQSKVLLRQRAGADWFWVPEKTGVYTVRAAVTDLYGAKAESERTFTVENGPGISLEASGGALGGHGGQKSWTVYSPGSWVASTNADFIRLENARGECGDLLTVTVDAATTEYREAVVTVSSGMTKIEWTVAQPASHGFDEEVYLFGDERLFVDGQDHTGWLNASGSRSFRVSAPDEWTAAADSSFIHVETNGDELTLTVDEPEGAAVRSGVVTVSGSTGAAYVHVYQLPAHRVQSKPQTLDIPTAAAQRVDMHSQHSGYWNEKKYGSSTLEHSGCAIFALSHALQWLGFEGEEIRPEALAKKYAFCLRDGGTVNATLVGNAGGDLGFKTRYDLYTNLSTIRSKLQEGAVFSFAIVNGHIAMVAEQSADGRMMRIIDSAPSATWERIQNARLYRQTENGDFVPVESLAELGDGRYYIENAGVGAASYWLEAEYVARRGVRLIQRK